MLAVEIADPDVVDPLPVTDKDDQGNHHPKPDTPERVRDGIATRLAQLHADLPDEAPADAVVERAGVTDRMRLTVRGLTPQDVE